jgi:hypothetical protein
MPLCSEGQELIMRLFALLFVILFGVGRVHAAEPAWAGVWSGTIGNAPIMLCLSHSDYRDQGAYYYRKHLKIITLRDLKPANGVPSGLHWMEGFDEAKAAESPQWQLTQADGSNLTGTWTPGPSRTSKPLPIKLVLIAKQPEDDSSYCGGEEFNGPRAVPVKLARSPAKQDGFAYTKIKADVGKHFDVAIETFELAGTTPAIRTINTALRKEIPSDPIKSDYFECVTGSLSSHATDGDYSVTTTPALISRNYMVSEHSQGDYCGGAHPNYFIEWSNWDLRTGVAIDLWSWMGPLAVTKEKKDGYTDITIKLLFRKALTQKWKTTNTEAECDFVGAENDYWTPHLSRKGISFYPQLAHAITACEQDVDFTFAEINPLLSPAGKKALAEFRADLKK